MRYVVNVSVCGMHVSQLYAWISVCTESSDEYSKPQAQVSLESIPDAATPSSAAQRDAAPHATSSRSRSRRHRPPPPPPDLVSRLVSSHHRQGPPSARDRDRPASRPLAVARSRPLCGAGQLPSTSILRTAVSRVFQFWRLASIRLAGRIWGDYKRLTSPFPPRVPLSITLPPQFSSLA